MCVQHLSLMVARGAHGAHPCSPVTLLAGSRSIDFAASHDAVG
jgi:hypothetical protein